MSKLIVIEGMEGAGKTSTVKALSEKLSKLSIDHVCVKEPGSAFDGNLRNLILDGRTSSKARALLYYADRAEVLDKITKPSLAAGKVVIYDRFITSSIVYQHYLLETLDLETVTCLNEFISAPKYTEILLLVSPETALKRVEQREDKVARIGVNSLDRLHELYIKVALKSNSTFISTDNKFPEEVAENIYQRFIK